MKKIILAYLIFLLVALTNILHGQDVSAVYKYKKSKIDKAKLKKSSLIMYSDSTFIIETIAHRKAYDTRLQWKQEGRYVGLGTYKIVNKKVLFYQDTNVVYITRVSDSLIRVANSDYFKK